MAIHEPEIGWGGVSISQEAWGGEGLGWGWGGWVTGLPLDPREIASFWDRDKPWLSRIPKSLQFGAGPQFVHFGNKVTLSGRTISKDSRSF